MLGFGSNFVSPYSSSLHPSIVSKRITCLEAFRNLYTGRTLWLNTGRLSKDVLESFNDANKDSIQWRAKSFLILGLSLSNLLYSTHDTQSLLSSWDQLMTDWLVYLKNEGYDGLKKVQDIFRI